MVFCYKFITASPSPTRSGNASPRKKSPMCRVPILPSSISQFMGSLNYETSSGGTLDAIPERDWKLLTALAKKREEDDERERLADEFHKMWQKEKEERAQVEAETTYQYRSYINKKRAQERRCHEHKRRQKVLQQQLCQNQLVSGIRHKERRSAELLACHGDKKATEIVEKAIIEEARAHLAADRRIRQELIDEWQKKMELASVQRRIDDASKRRDAILRDNSRRVAITNALNNWESSMLRQEITAIEASRHAHYAAQIALTEARSAELARTRERKVHRARKVAALTQQMRDAVRAGVI